MQTEGIRAPVRVQACSAVAITLNILAAVLSILAITQVWVEADFVVTGIGKMPVTVFKLDGITICPGDCVLGPVHIADERKVDWGELVCDEQGVTADDSVDGIVEVDCDHFNSVKTWYPLANIVFIICTITSVLTAGFGCAAFQSCAPKCGASRRRGLGTVAVVIGTATLLATLIVTIGAWVSGTKLMDDEVNSAPSTAGGKAEETSAGGPAAALVAFAAGLIASIINIAIVCCRCCGLKQRGAPDTGFQPTAAPMDTQLASVVDVPAPVTSYVPPSSGGAGSGQKYAKLEDDNPF